jgi:NAD(P)-dependent dehydrogenase (short-subunit alcohol dehydrogenase family)
MKTWFITGTSRGFGREWTLAALGRGDRVVATARNPKALADLEKQYGDPVPRLLQLRARPHRHPQPRAHPRSSGLRC